MGEGADKIGGEPGAQGIGEKCGRSQGRALEPEHRAVLGGCGADGGFRGAGTHQGLGEGSAGDDVGHHDMVAVHIVHGHLDGPGQKQAEGGERVAGRDQRRALGIAAFAGVQQLA